MRKYLLILLFSLSIASFGQGNEMLNNGGFSSGANWTAGVGWTITGGVANFAGVTGALYQLDGDMAISLEASHFYTLTFDIVADTSTNIRFFTNGGGTNLNRTDNYMTGSHSIQIITPANIGDGGLFIYPGESGSFTIDNISLRENAALGGGPYYVTPNGGDDAASGDITHPWKTPQKAFDIAQYGDIVYFRGGVYQPLLPLVIDSVSFHGHSGRSSAWIYYLAYPGEAPIIDFDNYVYRGTSTNYSGFGISWATYLYFKGITLRNAHQRKEYITVSGIFAYGCSNLTFRNVIVHDIGGRGIGFFGGFGNHYIDARIPDVPADTLRFINCDLYNLCDSLVTFPGATTGGAADGLKLDNRSGSYIQIDSCRAWRFSDNGFDPGSSSDSYPAMIHITNSYAFDGGNQVYENFGGEGSGFKYGNYIIVDTAGLIRIVRNNVAAFNKSSGFPENNSRSDPWYWTFHEHLYNNISYHNGDFGASYSRLHDGELSKEAFVNNISYMDAAPFEAFELELINDSYNSWNLPALIITDADFESVDSTGLTAPRQADGSLPNNDAFNKFLHLSATSDFINAGTAVIDADTTLSGFSGVAPDLGAFEYIESGGIAPLLSTNSISSIKSIEAVLGGNITSDGGAAITERGIVYGTSANPTTSNTKIVVSGTTGLFSTKLWSLKSNTTYHVRSFATNSVGTSYGADVSFTTKVSSPLSGGGKVYVMNGKIVVMD